MPNTWWCWCVPVQRPGTCTVGGQGAHGKEGADGARIVRGRDGGPGTCIGRDVGRSRAGQGPVHARRRRGPRSLSRWVFSVVGMDADTCTRVACGEERGRGGRRSHGVFVAEGEAAVAVLISAAQHALLLLGTTPGTGSGAAAPRAAAWGVGRGATIGRACGRSCNKQARRVSPRLFRGGASPRLGFGTGKFLRRDQEFARGPAPPLSPGKRPRQTPPSKAGPLFSRCVAPFWRLDCAPVLWEFAGVCLAQPHLHHTKHSTLRTERQARGITAVVESKAWVLPFWGGRSRE
jgi:hypothetical protein